MAARSVDGSTGGDYPRIEADPLKIKHENTLMKLEKISKNILTSDKNLQVSYNEIMFLHTDISNDLKLTSAWDRVNVSRKVKVLDEKVDKLMKKVLPIQQKKEQEATQAKERETIKEDRLISGTTTRISTAEATLKKVESLLTDKLKSEYAIPEHRQAEYKQLKSELSSLANHIENAQKKHANLNSTSTREDRIEAGKASQTARDEAIKLQFSVPKFFDEIAPTSKAFKMLLTAKDHLILADNHLKSAKALLLEHTPKSTITVNKYQKDFPISELEKRKFVALNNLSTAETILKSDPTPKDIASAEKIIAGAKKELQDIANIAIKIKSDIQLMTPEEETREKEIQEGIEEINTALEFANSQIDTSTQYVKDTLDYFSNPKNGPLDTQQKKDITDLKRLLDDSEKATKDAKNSLESFKSELVKSENPTAFLRKNDTKTIYPATAFASQQAQKAKDAANKLLIHQLKNNNKDIVSLLTTLVEKFPKFKPENEPKLAMSERLKNLQSMAVQEGFEIDAMLESSSRDLVKMAKDPEFSKLLEKVNTYKKRAQDLLQNLISLYKNDLYLDPLDKFSNCESQFQKLNIEISDLEKELTHIKDPEKQKSISEKISSLKSSLSELQKKFPPIEWRNLHPSDDLLYDSDEDFEYITAVKALSILKENERIAEEANTSLDYVVMEIGSLNSKEYRIKSDISEALKK